MFQIPPVADLLQAACHLKEIIDALKQQHVYDFEWYPHDTLSNAVHLERLLAARYESLLPIAQVEGVLDLGAQDGEMSFLFESLGCQVTTFDNPATNHNGMLGIRALKQLLDSSIDIRDVDLDSRFSDPRKHYGLALFLGVLYHLKNPFYALEYLAKHSKYCVLSTRIARRFTDGTEIPSKHPLAYLLDVNELNEDNSNYWIFSETGLLRLFKRTHWEVLESFSGGDTVTSDPNSLNRDERAFYLLQSHFGATTVDLVDGWHDAEASGWRWTRQRFVARIHFDDASKPERIVLHLFVPAALMERLGPVTLSAFIDGCELQSATFTRAGEHEFIRRFKPVGNEAVINFALDKSLPPEQNDRRERGLVIAALDIE